MDTVRLTTAQAIVRYLVAQRTVVDGREAPLFPGVFAIFGHGNVTGLGNALDEARDDAARPSRDRTSRAWRSPPSAFAKATRRRQIMVATSSIGPGATNMVTAAGAALANRLPLLLLCGDTFQSRVPDPVLQQVEHFGVPSTTVNDAFRAVTRYWDRIVSPEQVVQSLPLAVETMLDPADCGPGVPRVAPGRPGGGLRLPGSILRAARARAAAAAPRPARARRGDSAPPRGAAAGADRRRRRPLLARRGRSRARSWSATGCRWSRRWPARPA